MKRDQGDCFKAAGQYLFNVSRRDSGRLDDLVLVHGEVTGQGRLEGVKFGHAWVEDERRGVVIDKSNGRDIELPIALYYAAGKIELTYRYRWDDFIEKVTETGHWGPWDLETSTGL